MSSPNNMDLVGMVSRVFNPPASNDQILTELQEKDPELRDVVAAAMTVHGHLGHGFLPEVYAQALAVEFDEAKLPHQAREKITLNYRGRLLDTGYEADFICFGDTLVLVMTAAKGFEQSHDLQLINHLKCTQLRRGLYLCFGLERVDFRRIVAPKQDASP